MGAVVSSVLHNKVTKMRVFLFFVAFIAFVAARPQFDAGKSHAAAKKGIAAAAPQVDDLLAKIPGQYMNQAQKDKIKKQLQGAANKGTKQLMKMGEQMAGDLQKKIAACGCWPLSKESANYNVKNL